MPKRNHRILSTCCAVLLPAIASMHGLQASEADSLRRLLPDMDKAERLTTLETLLELSYETDDTAYQLRCANELIGEARRQHNAMEEANALAHRATIYYNNDMNDSVFAVLPADLARIRAFGLGNEHTRQVYYEIWAHIANTYVFAGQNNLAIHETMNMFDDAKNHDDSFGMGIAYGIMGTAYANLRSFDQSIDAFQKSLALLSSQDPLPPILPDTYAYFGNALNDMKAYDELQRLTYRWKEDLDRFMAQHQLMDNPIADVYLSYYHMACVQAALGQQKLEQAEEQLALARTHILTLESFHGGKWLYYTAQLNLQAGRFDKALAYNNLRLEQLATQSDQSVVVMVRQQRAEIMERLHRYEEAARLYRSIYLLNDSLNAQDTKAQLNEMNTIFQVNELEMEKERAQMRFIYIALTIIAVALGVILFFRMRSARKLQQAHAKLQTAYADLQAANEVIEQTTAAKERIESELRIARQIQMGMVPATFPTLPDLFLYASMTPAKEVGGDLYDYLFAESATDTPASRKLYFCLGDVSGKGVPASLFMSQATRLFRALAKQGLMPAEIATRLNDELTENNDNGMFVTMFIGLADLDSGHLHFCNAGHNPPVLIRNGKALFLEMEPNAPIGLWPGLDYEGEQIESIADVPMLIYTDGLNEAENQQQEQFGDDRLLELLQQTPFVSARQTIDMLKNEVEKHRDGAEPNDDLTMLCLEIKKNCTTKT